MSEEFNTDCTDEIICPYCGHEHEASYSTTSANDDGHHQCEKTFNWLAHREVINYSTSKLPCLNWAEHKYRYMSKNISGTNFYKCRVCGEIKMDGNPS